MKNMKVDFVKAARKANKSVTDIHEETGVPVRTLQKLFYEGANVKFVIRLAAICKCLGCELSDLVSKD